MRKKTTAAQPETWLAPGTSQSVSMRSPIARRTGTHLSQIGQGLVALWVVLAALLTATQTDLSRFLERQLQVLFFEVRGAVTPPDEIVILAMDADSLSQGTRIYPTDPQRYADLEPLHTVPWKRAAYAIAIQRLMQAGAQGVGIDVVLDAPSSHGAADDALLHRALQQYGDRVALAALYADDQTREGIRTHLLLPHPVFQVPPQRSGFINYPLEANGRIQALGSQYPLFIARSYPPALADSFLNMNAEMFSFAEATLRVANLPLQPSVGQSIYFYGPAGTFPTVPFWQVLDPESWAVHQHQGTFRDKIVLIGPTAELYQDFHAAPFAKTILHPTPMSGVEINANAIATLKQHRALRDVMPNAWLQGGFVLVLAGGAVYLQTRPKRLLRRFFLAIAIALTWGGISYTGFIYGQWLLPTAIPMAAIAWSGVSYLFIGLVGEKLSLRKTLKPYAGSPMVREIISQLSQDDLKDLIQGVEQAVVGKRLAGRYRIVSVLGAGGFGETYLAEDTLRPGNPQCVVKKLRPASNNPVVIKYAQQLFEREAVILQALGTHDQIPQLLAYFAEEDDFYLVQEFIDGIPLNQEFSLGKQIPEARVVTIVQEILQVLAYIHRQKVIHRDIKPSNIMRRSVDNKLVLIDFGAVKVSEHGEQNGETRVTIGIGTKGYMPNEQCAGTPRYSSDIYALGMTAIEALTGVPARQLKEDLVTGEIIWQSLANVSQTFAAILNKMVRYDFRKRYQQAADVLEDLMNLVQATANLERMAESPYVAGEATMEAGEKDSDMEAAMPTRLWIETVGNIKTELSEPGTSTNSEG